ncbi:hypothetical protein BGZ61DRAFT_558136 [Ilyonectria robusta]|uniref:uncharacterized protein n=1 Tax=Ilyonectria robusta TaxID=1079257 RepID=UPI001E8EB18F|nr:uncharacterized protein BGZ61DRAFT_558136 [Ilyonectria robusta]KAH8667728.1 hypothetical protein BGZ61DRAFT_558136 [Ilyonectria robusta]
MVSPPIPSNAPQPGDVKFNWVVDGRRPRASRILNDELDRYKNQIYDMYITANMTRSEVIRILAEVDALVVSPDQFSKATKRWGFQKHNRRHDAPNPATLISIPAGNTDDRQDQHSQSDDSATPASTVSSVEVAKRPRSVNSWSSLADSNHQPRHSQSIYRPPKRPKCTSDPDTATEENLSTQVDITAVAIGDTDAIDNPQLEQNGDSQSPSQPPPADSVDSPQNSMSDLDSTSSTAPLVEDEVLAAEFLACCYMFNRAFRHYRKAFTHLEDKPFSSKEKRSRILDLARTAKSSANRETACGILESELEAGYDPLSTANNDTAVSPSRESIMPERSFLIHRHLAKLYSHRRGQTDQVQQHLDKARNFTNSDTPLDLWTLCHLSEGTSNGHIPDKLLSLLKYDDGTFALVIKPCLRWCRKQLQPFQNHQPCQGAQIARMSPTALSQLVEKFNSLALWADTSFLFAYLWKDLQLSPPPGYDQLTWLDADLLPGISTTHFLMIICRMIVDETRVFFKFKAANLDAKTPAASGIPGDCTYASIPQYQMAIDSLISDGETSAKEVKRRFVNSFYRHHSWTPPIRQERELVLQLQSNHVKCLNSTMKARQTLRSPTPTHLAREIPEVQDVANEKPKHVSLNEFVDIQALDEMMETASLNDSGSHMSVQTDRPSRASSCITMSSTASLNLRHLYIGAVQGNPAISRTLVSVSRLSHSSLESRSSSLRRFIAAGRSVKSQLGGSKPPSLNNRNSSSAGLDMWSDWDGDPGMLSVSRQGSVSGTEFSMADIIEDQRELRPELRNSSEGRFLTPGSINDQTEDETFRRRFVHLWRGRE